MVGGNGDRTVGGGVTPPCAACVQRNRCSFGREGRHESTQKVTYKGKMKAKQGTGCTKCFEAVICAYIDLENNTAANAIEAGVILIVLEVFAVCEGFVLFLYYLVKLVTLLV